MATEDTYDAVIFLRLKRGTEPEPTLDVHDVREALLGCAQGLEIHVRDRFERAGWLERLEVYDVDKLSVKVSVDPMTVQAARDAIGA